MSSRRVTCVGLAVMDKIFGVSEIPTRPMKVFADAYSQIGGGPAATAAVTIARLGGYAELWARVGADAVGAEIIRELTGWGVKPRVREVPGAKSSVSGVFVDRSGERLIASFTDGALDPDPSWLPFESLASADLVLVDSRWPEANKAALKAARVAGIPSMLDADLAPGEVLHTLAPLADYVIFSEAALARFCAIDDAAQGLEAAKKVCPGLVGVTLGADGFLWLDDGAIRHEPAATVNVVDTLGAGDVFHGALALALAEGMTIREAARFANVAAGLKCTRSGGRAGIPDREEVDEALRRHQQPGAGSGSRASI